MTSLLVTILPKLIDVKPYLFEYSGLTVRNTYSQILSRNLNISPNKSFAIAIILQQSNLSDFSDEELLSLANLKLERIFANLQPIKLPKILTGSTIPHDTLNGTQFDLADYSKEVCFNYCTGLVNKKNVNIQELLLELS